VARLFLTLIVVAVTVYAFIDCLRSDDGEVQHLPRPVWLLLTLVPLVGGLAWLALGRVRESGFARGSAPRAVAPDDDPDFLRSLERWRRRDSRTDSSRPGADPAPPPAPPVTDKGPRGASGMDGTGPDPERGAAPDQPHRSPEPGDGD
jgi:hypothetical protein